MSLFILQWNKRFGPCCQGKKFGFGSTYDKEAKDFKQKSGRALLNCHQSGLCEINSDRDEGHSVGEKGIDLVYVLKGERLMCWR